MEKKIFNRFLLLIIATTLCATICVTLAFYAIFEKQVHEDMRITAQIFKDIGFFDTADISALENNPKLSEAKLRVTLMEPDGTVIFDNTVDAAKMDNHSNRPEFVEALDLGTGEIVRKSDTVGMVDYYYALKLNDGRILRIAKEVDAIWMMFASALPLSLALMLLIAFVSTLLSNLLTKQLMKPIEEVATHIDDEYIEAPYPELYPFISKIRKQHEQVLEAAKMRQDFSANVSHELKTPLTAITGYAELLEASEIEDKSRVHFAKEIEKNSHRLLALIEDIIKISELDADDNEEEYDFINLYELASEEVETLQLAAQRSDITLSISGNPVAVRARADLIRELIDNLVQNSIRYNHDGGNVQVSVFEKLGVKQLIVEDDGIGIPKEDLDRVFERFYRVDKSHSKATGGTGLGLAIVKHIVELHDARIQLESEVGEGTKITVSF